MTAIATWKNHTFGNPLCGPIKFHRVGQPTVYNFPAGCPLCLYPVETFVDCREMEDVSEHWKTTITIPVGETGPPGAGWTDSGEYNFTMTFVGPSPFISGACLWMSEAIPNGDSSMVCTLEAAVTGPDTGLGAPQTYLRVIIFAKFAGVLIGSVNTYDNRVGVNGFPQGDAPTFAKFMANDPFDLKKGVPFINPLLTWPATITVKPTA